MIKYLHQILLALMLVPCQMLFSQGQEVSGTVVSSSTGVPIPQVNITIEGKDVGTVTNFDGVYSINASEGDILVFSYTGMTTKRVKVGSSAVIDVELKDDLQELDAVVITAFGIKKEQKALSYSAQEVSGDEFTRVRQTNPVNSLSGKTAGLRVSRSASGLGGSSKVVLRGNSSTTDNNALYVVDGIPILNNGNGKNGDANSDIFGSRTGSRDGGDITSLINPDDIKSVSVLKGASAAALYGSKGVNGVVLITTKSGKKGKVRVSYNSNFTANDVFLLPELQTEYQSPSVGQPIQDNGRVANPKSWGEKTSGLTNTVDDFFQTGNTFTNSITVSGGTETAQTYFSFANTIAEGTMPGNELTKNIFNLKESISLFDDRLKITGNINLSDQRIDNKPTIGLYSNTLTGLYLNPVGIDLNEYKDFEYFNEETNMMDQYATSFDENIQQNPYWLVNRNIREDVSQRVYSSINISYQINEELTLKTRGNYDKSFFTFDQRLYAGSDQVAVPDTGRYIYEETENTQQYIDFTATYDKEIFNDVNFSLTTGSILSKLSLGDQTLMDSGNAEGLRFPNEFTVANFETSQGIAQSVRNKETQSVFFAGNVGIDDTFYFDVTGRNDWSSTLVNTNSTSFFYPSFGVTTILDKLFELPESVNYAKIRGSYAEVGKDIPAFATSPLRTIGTINNPGGNLGSANQAPFAPREGETLEPELQKSFEVGTEWRFFGSRLGVDLTYYNSDTENQIFFIDAEANVEGFEQNIVNAGKIKNEGVEIVLSGRPIRNADFSWSTIVNYASNTNTVESVHPSLENGEAILTGPGVNGYGYSLVEGEDFGSIRAQSLVRNDDGLPVADVSEDGTITLQSTEFQTVAHAQPDFTFGWNNNFTFKNFTFDFLIDGKVGGNVLSVTEAINDFYGVSQASADARNRNNGFIDVVDNDGNPLQMTARNYFTQIGGRAGLLGEYVYDATNVSLREVSVGYDFNKTGQFFDDIKLSLIATNLFFIYKDAPFDPNITSSTGIGLQGVDIYGLPTKRSAGLNLNLKF